MCVDIRGKSVSLLHSASMDDGCTKYLSGLPVKVIVSVLSALYAEWVKGNR